MFHVEHIVSSQCCLGEGPVWHPFEHVLYWLDIYQSQLHRFDPSTGDHRVTDLGLIVTAMGVRARGGFVMATGKGFAFWDPQAGSFQFVGDPDASENNDIRFNDGKTDRQGHFWAGKMSSREENKLYRLDPQGNIFRMEHGIAISNGLGWSPDNRTFYFTDSQVRKIYAYDFNPQDESISNRRVFADVPKTAGEGLPDGLAVDVEGCIWSARWGGWKVVRYDPNGRIIDEIAMPVEFPTSCAFGGDQLDDLYITSAWTEVISENRATQPLAGDLFRVKVKTAGFPEPVFQG